MGLTGNNIKETPSTKRTKLLSGTDATAYLGIEAQTQAVWPCTRRYGMPNLRTGKDYRFNRDAVVAVLLANAERSTGKEVNRE